MAATTSLDGAVVAVVGASGGLGAPICDAPARRGAHVVRAGTTSDVAVDRREPDAGDHIVAAAIERHGVRVVDVRPPDAETGLAGRPLAGSAPKLPQGLDPAAVAERIVVAIEQGDDDVASTAFA